MTAKGTFEVYDWTPGDSLSDADGVAIAPVTMKKTFSGDLVGSSVVYMTATSTPVEASRSYVAIERVVGALDGREGTFLLQHSAFSDDGVQALRVRVVADSGTGGFTGLRGELEIHIDENGGHSYVFDWLCV